jgi:hypothetical protein
VLDVAGWTLVEQLFARVFGHAIDRRETHWKYDAPQGLSLALLDDEGTGQARAIAHCGLMFREVLMQGQPIRAAQFTDLMVDPLARHAFNRHGSAFAKIIASAIELLGSSHNPGNPDRIFYGFPSGRAMRLGERLGHFREVDQLHELHWTPAHGPLPTLIETPGPRVERAVNRLWQEMRYDLREGVIGVRDADWFLSRFLRHPTRQYHVHLLESDDELHPRAIFALKETGHGIELSDWVAPLRETQAMIQSARAQAAALRGTTLYTWITRNYLGLLDASAQRVEPTQFRVPCRGDSTEAEVARISNRWWLTPGDTDYR